MVWAIIFIGFLLLVAYNLEKAAKRDLARLKEAVEKACPPHVWRTIKCNPDDPESPDALVCMRCKWHPNSNSHL